MEKEKYFDKAERYKNSSLYRRLGQINHCPPECMDLYLSELVKVTYACNEDRLLNIMDILTGFLNNYEKLNDAMKTKIIDTTVDKIIPILDKKNFEETKSLLAEDYSIILENLEDIKENSETEIASKCFLAIEKLTFKEEL